MGWTKALFGHLTMWSSSKKKSSDSDSSSSYQPVFAVDRTEVAVATTTDVPELTLRDLNKATKSFSASMVIGQGQSATAYRATLPIGSGGKADAVAKRLSRPPSCLSVGTWSDFDDEFLRQQVLVLSRLRHDNVVRLLGYTIDAAAGVRALLFEFADMGTLYHVLHGTAMPTLSWEQRARIALDVARGLEYLHDAAEVTHWGICSSKVLLFQAGFRAKIADYGLSMQLPQDVFSASKAPNKGVSWWYYPPEYVMKCVRSRRKYDVYSYGVLLLELLTGRNKCPVKTIPLPWAAPIILRERRLEGFMDPKLGTEYPPARALKLARLALCCLQEKPQSRPTMAEVAQIINCDIVSSETTMAK